MAQFVQVNSRKIIMGKFDYDCDLLEELTDICIQNNVTLGRIDAIGAVSKARK